MTNYDRTAHLKSIHAPTPKQIKCEMNDANKDILIETLKRKIKALENENKELREEMKKAYAQINEKF